MRPSTTHTARLELNISAELHILLKHATALQGRTITDFIVSVAQEAAQRVIEETEVIRLSLTDQKRFVQALLSPPKPTPALKRAFARHHKLLHTHE